MSAELALVKDDLVDLFTHEDELLSTAEIAELEGVSERTVRDKIKELNFLPSMMKKNEHGHQTPLFSYHNWKLFSDYETAKQLLHKESLVALTIGTIEIHGTAEQVALIRTAVDSLRRELDEVKQKYVKASLQKEEAQFKNHRLLKTLKRKENDEYVCAIEQEVKEDFEEFDAFKSKQNHISTYTRPKNEVELIYDELYHDPWWLNAGTAAIQAEAKRLIKERGIVT